MWDIRNGSRVATLPVYEALEGERGLQAGLRAVCCWCCAVRCVRAVHAVHAVCWYVVVPRCGWCVVTTANSWLYPAKQRQGSGTSHDARGVTDSQLLGPLCSVACLSCHDFHGGPTSTHKPPGAAAVPDSGTLPCGGLQAMQHPGNRHNSCPSRNPTHLSRDCQHAQSV